MISNAPAETACAAEEAVTTEDLLNRLAEDNARQTAALEKQLFWTKVQTCTLCVALVVALVLTVSFMGRINSALDQLDVVLTDVQSLTSSLATTVDEADLTGLLNNANELIVKSEDSLTAALAEVEDAVAQLKKIDFDGLNSAITDLQAVVEPLARLFGR